MAMLPTYTEIVDLIKKGSTIAAQEKIIELREAAITLQEDNLRPENSSTGKGRITGWVLVNLKTAHSAKLATTTTRN